MPITVQYQPSAAAYGSAAYAAGAENLRRYEQAQAFQQQQLAQQAALQREGYANQRAMQGQQLDYNSRAAALGILADQQSRTQQYAQQQTLQDQQLQSAAQLQDQRLQYGAAELQAQLASRAALQEQSLGAQFARQYLQGQQQYGLNQQQFMNNAALSQQSYLQNLDFTQYKLDAQAQAQLNQIRQNRARLEQMKLSGQINDTQYQYADADIKARELGLSKTLPMQQNTDLVSQLNNSLVQHSETGAWMQQDPQTGMWDVVNTQQNQQQDQMAVQRFQAEQKQQQSMADAMIKMYMDQVKLREPGDPLPDLGKIEQIVRAAYGQGSASGIDGGLYQQERQMLGMSQPGGNPGMGQRVIQVRNDADVMKLAPGTVYLDPQGNRRVRR